MKRIQIKGSVKLTFRYLLYLISGRKNVFLTFLKDLKINKSVVIVSVLICIPTFVTLSFLFPYSYEMVKPTKLYLKAIDIELLVITQRIVSL